jgi:hypothetical protein
VTRRRRDLVLVSETDTPERAHKCDTWPPLWTADRGPIKTCQQHYGEPVNAHPSLRGA